MALIKPNDDRFTPIIKAGKLVMPYYSPRGQEVIPAAISRQPERQRLPLHDLSRHPRHARQGRAGKLLWAELAGRATGTCKGKGGPMHITHPAAA